MFFSYALLEGLVVSTVQFALAVLVSSALPLSVHMAITW